MTTHIAKRLGWFLLRLLPAPCPIYAKKKTSPIFLASIASMVLGALLVFGRSATLWATDFDELNDERAVYGVDVITSTDGDDTTGTTAYNDTLKQRLRDQNGNTPTGWLTESNLQKVTSNNEIDPTGAEIEHVTYKLSPRLNEELVLIQTKQSTSPLDQSNRLDAYFRAAGATAPTPPRWTLHFEAANLLTTGGYKSQIADAAYEQNSGDALIVYRDTGTTLFSKVVRGPVTARQAVGGGGIVPNASTINMVRLYPRRDSDEVLAVLSEGTGNIWTSLWNGVNSWAGVLDNGTAGPSTYATKIASGVTNTNWPWDATSFSNNRMMVVYQGSGSNIRFRILDRSLIAAVPSWSAEGAFGPFATIDQIDIEANSTGSRIALVGYSGSNGIFAAMWDDAKSGAACQTPTAGNPPNCWTISPSALDTYIAATYNGEGTPAAIVGWAGRDTAILVYPDRDNANQLSYTDGIDWAKWTAAIPNWAVQTDALNTLLPPATQEIAVVGHSYINANKFMLMFVEPDNSTQEKLLTAVYDQDASGGAGAWSLVDTRNAPLTATISMAGSGASAISGKPFDFGLNSFILPNLTLANSPARVPVATPSSGTLGPSIELVDMSNNPLTITIVDPAGVIEAGDNNYEDTTIDPTTNEDIEIALPGGLGIQWDPDSTGTFCISDGTLNGSNGALKVAHETSIACQTKYGGGWYDVATNGFAHLGAGATNKLYLDVLTNFTFGNRLIIKGLRIKCTIGALAAPLADIPIQVNFRTDEVKGDVDGEITASGSRAQMQLLERLDMTNSAVSNAFIQTGALVGKTLLQFTANATGGNVKITQVDFSTSFGTSPMAWSHITKLELLEQVGAGSPVVVATTNNPTNASFPGLIRTIAAGTANTYTLRADVNLSAGDSMMVSLSSIRADGVSSTYANLQGITGAVVIPGGISFTHTTPETLTLTNVAVTNAFIQTGSLAGKSLASFTVAAGGAAGGSATLTRLNFSTMTFANGMNWGNITNLYLYEGGTVLKTLVAPTGADFTGLTSAVTVGTPKTYTLKADLNLSAGHQLTVALPVAGVEGYGAAYGAALQLQTVTNAITISGAAITKTHTTPETLTLANTAVANAFTQTGVLTGKDVLKFSATAAGGTVKTTRLNFSVSFGGGMAWANVSKLELWDGGGSAIATKNSPANADFTVLASNVATGTPKTYTVKADLTGLAAGHMMTISLPVAGVEADGTTSGTTNLQTVLSAITISGTAISKTHTTPESLTLANVAVNNAFTQTGVITGKDVLKVSGTAAGGNVTTKRLKFTVTFSGGMAWANVTKLELWDGGGSAIATKNSPVANADFTGLTSAIASGASKTYILRGDFTGLLANYQMTVNIAPSVPGPTGDVEADGTTSGTSNLQSIANAIAVSGAAITKDHTVSSYTITLPATVKYQDPLSVSWVKTNVTEPTQFEYSTDGKALSDPTKTWIDFTGPPTARCPSGSVSPCSATAPSSDATTPVSASAYVRLKGNESTDNQSLTSPAVSSSFKVLERLRLDPPATQVPNALIQIGAMTGADLLKVKLTATGGGVQFSRVNFSSPVVGAGPYSGADGLITFGNYELWDTTTATPVKVAGPLGSPDFTGLTVSLAKDEVRSYTIRANVSGLDPGETLAMSLTPASIDAKGSVTTVQPLAIDGSIVSANHVVSSYVVTSPLQNQEVVVASSWAITWATYGLADPVNVSMEFRTNGGSWTALTCNAPRVAGRCDTNTPDSVSNNVELRLSDGTHQSLSKVFTIAGIVQIDDPVGSALNLPGGRTWLIGHNYPVTWQQLGSFTTILELSTDGGSSFPYGLGSLVANASVLSPFTITCTNLGSTTCASGLPKVGTNTAKVRARPQGSVTTSGNRESTTFLVKPAFINVGIQGVAPGAEIVKSRSNPVTWQLLAGTEPLSINPSSVFPIDAVTIKLLDPSDAVLQTLTPANPPTSNNGTFAWTPNLTSAQVRLRICDKAHPTICGDSLPFDIIDLSVAVTPTPVRAGSTVSVDWAGIDPAKDVKLMLLDQNGVVLLDVLDNAMPVDKTRSANLSPYPWPVPSNLTTPMQNVKIRVEQSDNSAVFAETALFDIKGNVRVDAPDGGETFVAGQSTTIRWTVTAGTIPNVRVRSSLNGTGGPWSDLALNASGTSLPWTPPTVTSQGRIEVCDAQDLAGTCDVSNADFVVAGTLALGENASGQPVNAFVQMPTVTNEELYRFKLTASGESVTVQSLTFGVAAVGISASDISGLSLLKDGVPVTATFNVSPAGNPTQIVATLTGVTVSGAANFSLKGTVSNIIVGDEITFSLAGNGTSIQAQGSTSLADIDALAGALSGSVSTMRHFVKTYQILAPVAGANWPVSTTQSIDWTPINGASATNVTIRYSTDGGTNYTQIVSAANVTKPYPWAIPLTAISAQAKILIEDRATPTVVGYSGGTKSGNAFNITGQVTVTAPTTDSRYADSLSRWPVGTPHTISWTTVGAMSQFKVYVDGTEISGSPTAATSISYTPSVPSASSIVKVVDVTAGHPAAEGTATVVFSAVQVIAPTVSSAWQVGSAQSIGWVETGLETVDLFYRTGGGIWQPIVLGINASTASSNWTIPAAARSPQVEVRVRDAIDATNGAVALSSVFKVYGALQLGSVSGVAVNAPKTLTWTTSPAASVPNVTLSLIDIARGQTSTIAANQANTGTFNWTPALATSQAKIHICDSDFPTSDTQACNDSNTFSISGVAVNAVPVGPHLVGSVLSVGWTQEGISSGQVRVAYTPDGGSTWKTMAGATCTLPCGTLTATGASGSYNWTIPDDLTTNAKVRVADNASPAYGESNVFGITGRLTVTAPVAPGNVFAVTDTMPITWTKLGTIPAVDLEYSTNGGTSWLPITGGVAGTSFNWVLPTNVIASNMLVRVVDSAGVGATPAHPFTEGRSGSLKVGAKFTFTAPIGGENWAVNSAQDVQWSVTGAGVTSIKLAYSTNGSTYTDFATVAMAGTSGEAKTFTWTVADLVAAMGDPQVTPTRPFTVRITDATGAAHPVVAPSIGQTVSASLSAMYYKVDWKVQDISNGNTLSNLQVSDSTGWTNDPDFNMSGAQTRYYPYLDQVTTLWLLINNNGSSDLSQGPADVQPVPIWKSDRDQTRIAKIEVTSSDSVTWQVHAEQQYDNINNLIEISAWLEKSGKVVDTLLTDGFVEFYEDGALIRTVPQLMSAGAGVLADANGNFRFTWDLKRDDGTSVPDGKTVFAKTIIRRSGRTFSTGGSLNIAIPKKILSGTGGTGGSGSGVTLTELQTELQPIKDATVGPTAILATTIGGQINTAQTAIQSSVTASQSAVQTSISSSQSALSTQITGVQTTADLIKTETDKIQGVKAYLEDANAGLPKILSNQTTMQDQLKAQRRGGILNRSLEVEKGKSAVIRYRAVDGAVAPKISVIDPLGAAVVTSAPMASVGSNMFEYSLAGAVEGEYRVTVNEDPSADSAGTLDGAMVTVVLPRATSQDVAGLGTQLDDLSTQLTSVETNLNTRLDVINGAMATKTQVDGVVTKVDQLLAKWGTHTADEFKTAMDGIFAAVGLTAKSTELASLAKTTDLAPLAKSTELAGLATQTSVDAVNTKLGTPANGTVSADIAAISAATGAIDYTGRFDTIDSALGTVAKSAELAPLAKDATVAKSSELAVLAKSSELAGLAKTTDLSPLAKSAELAGLAQSSELTPLAKSVELAGLAKTTDLSPLAKTTDVQAVSDKLGAPTSGTIAGDIAAIPGAIDYSSRFNTIDTAISALQSAVDAITGGAGGPGGPGGGGSLTDLQTAVDALQASIGTPAGTTVLGDLNTVKTTMAKDATVAKSAELAGLAKTTDLAGLAQSSELALLAKTTDLAGLAKTTDLAPLAKSAELGALAKDATVAKSSELAGLAQSSELTPLAKSAELAGLAKTTDLAGLATSAQLSPLAKSAELTPLAKEASVAAIDTKLGTPAGASMSADIAAIAGATGAIDYTAQFTAIQNDLTTLKTSVNDPAQATKLQSVQDAVDAIGVKITALPTTTGADYSANFSAISTALDALNTAVGALKTDVASAQSSITSVGSSVAALPTTSGTAAAASTGGLETASLMAKLNDLQKEVQSAAGSSAAVGMAQGAYSAASEALKILQQIQTNMQQNGGAGNSQVPVLLGKFGEQMKQVSGNINVLPGQLSEDAEVLAQIKKLTEQAKGIASDKGYAFDSLYEMSKEQKGDVKTMRNQVEELKALVEVQRALLEKNMNQPVMKTWFEAR